MKFKEKIIEKSFDYFKNGGRVNTFCEMLNINRATFSKWKKKYPKFKEAIIKGKKEFWNF